MISKKKIVFSITAISCIFFLIEFIGNSIYYLKRDRFFYTYHSKKIEGFIHFTPHGLNRWKPNVTAHMPGYPSFLYTDRYGFIHNGLDREISSNTYNIFLTGGSTVEGRGSSSNEKTISSYLEKFLNSRLIDKDIRVINAGFSGDTTYQELTRIFGHLVPNFKIDMVISISGRNDGHNTIYRGKYFKPNIDNEAFDLFEKNFNNLKTSCISCSIDKKLKKYSITYYSINFYINKLFIKRDKLNINFKESYNLPLNKIPFNVYSKNTFNNLSTIKHRLDLENIKFVSFLQPTLLENLKKNFSEKEDKNTKKWILESNYVDYFLGIENFYSELQKHTNKQWFFNISDIFLNNKNELYWDSLHYNDLANKLIADTIATKVIEMNYIR
jgi:hypothetical protein